MKALVVYYSLEGNCGYIANDISKAINADILELKPKKDIKSKGFMKFLKGGRQVITGFKPELYEFDKNPSEYDLLFIGTPVWASSFAPAINTFLSSTNLKGKKVAMFACYGGNEGKTFDNIKHVLAGSEFVGEIGFKNPLKNNKSKDASTAAEWAKEIQIRSNMSN